MKKRETKEGKSLKIEKESKQAQISSHDKNRYSIQYQHYVPGESTKVYAFGRLWNKKCFYDI